jgi:HAD superfamily hydrolase (TIGR01459 family)
MPNTITLPRRLTGLAAIAERFDGVLLDQWGVLHDGAKAPPGAIDAVASLAADGKRLVVVSNSARLGSDSRARLVALGYEPTNFTGFITSGETTRNLLRDRADPFFATLGRRVLLIARDATLIAGLDYMVADSVETADFVLLGSNTAPEQTLAGHYTAPLQRAASRGIPLICANPDRVGVTPEGLVEGPGVLAAFYAAIGGIVRYIGKPHPEVYAGARALMADVPPERIVAIGDSREHDIGGGGRAGLLTCFIEEGIHAKDVARPRGMETLIDRHAVAPDFTMARLAW